MMPEFAGSTSATGRPVICQIEESPAHRTVFSSQDKQTALKTKGVGRTLEKEFLIKVVYTTIYAAQSLMLFAVRCTRKTEGV